MFFQCNYYQISTAGTIDSRVHAFFKKCLNEILRWWHHEETTWTRWWRCEQIVDKLIEFIFCEKLNSICVRHQLSKTLHINRKSYEARNITLRHFAITFVVGDLLKNVWTFFDDGTIFHFYFTSCKHFLTTLSTTSTTNWYRWLTVPEMQASNSFWKTWNWCNWFV